MKAILQPNPNKQPVIKYDRVTDIRKKDGIQTETATEEKELTRAPGTKEVLCANPSWSKGGALNTGLDVLAHNDYADETAYRSKEFEAALKGKKEAKLQHILEYKHEKPFNYYTNQVDFMKKYNQKNLDTIPFFQTADAYFKAVDGANFLDTNNPREEIIYHYLSAPGRVDVAPSFADLRGEHKWLLTTQEEIETNKSSKRKEKNAIIAKFEEVSDKGADTLIQFCKVLNIASKNMSKDQAYTALDNYINQKDKKGEFAREEFNSIYKLYNDKKSVEVFNVRALVWELDAYRVVYKFTGTEYKWQPPKDESGSTPEPVIFKRLDELTKFILDPKHSVEVTQMENQLKAKKGYE